MGMGRAWVITGALVLCVSTAAMALEAVVELNEPGWYTAKKFTKYGGTELNKFYAPLPVFFEGWKSSPRNDIIEYLWDFGDGSPTFRGFNAAHIYETPGTYTATLTVVDTNGATAQATKQIEVLERTGITYYVDSELGDDANDGKSPATAWRTATYAFGQVNVTKFKPGDRCLFKRGQTFEMQAGVCAPGHYKVGYGYYFGAYGEGDKPLIQHVGTSTLPLIKFAGMDAAHWGLVDLQFDMTSPEGAMSDGMIVTAQAMNLYFLRCDFRNFKQGLGFNGKAALAGYVISNVFVVDSTTATSDNVHLYVAAHNFALIGSHLDLGGNHLAYCSYVDRGVFSGNLFTRPAFGRRGLRVSGSDGIEYPSNNVYVGNNVFTGWVDPLIDGDAHAGGGTRYTWLMVEFGPNTATDQGMEYAIFENNVITDAEQFVKFGDWEHVIVRNNTMRTVSPYAGSPRFRIGHEFEHRPVKDIQILNNTIETYENRSGDSGVFTIFKYGGPAYTERTIHEDIRIEGNRVTMVASKTRLISAPSDLVQLAAIRSNGNVVYTTDGAGLFQVGGTYNSVGTVYSLAEWVGTTGNDRASYVFTGPGAPLPGIALSPASWELGAIPVTYEGATCTNESGLKDVRLWAKKDAGDWYDTGLVSPSSKGRFDFFPMAGAGTYYFSLQAADKSGALTPEPSGRGHTDTVYSGGILPDTTAPVVGAVSAPALATALPIAISYAALTDSGGSGLKLVRLWVKKDDGAWSDSGVSSEAAAGVLSFADATGDGVYCFALQGEDNAGNRSLEPSGSGAATTRLDVTPPTAGTLTAPALAKSAPLSLSLAGASDGGSGLKQVTLWAKKDSAAWAATSLKLTAGSGIFSYTPSQGSGTYAFSLVATDVGGLVSAAPSGTGLAQTLYDVTPPVAGQLAAPGTVSQRPITLSYSGAGDGHSGLKALSLWVKKGSAGSWSNTGLSAATASGTFAFNDTSGSDTYWFALQAEDTAGNLSAAPSDAIAVAATFEAAFTSGTVSAPPYAKSSPIKVDYSGAAASEAGLKAVRLWYRKDTGAWMESGQTSTGGSGTFAFAPTGEGTYGFALQAESNSGDKTAIPSGGGDASTVYDATPPERGTVTTAAIGRTVPIGVAYAGVTDSGSGLNTVDLWVKKDAAAWTKTALSHTGEAGTFDFAPSEGAGTYAFALVATDKAGVSTPVPTGSGQASIVYDNVAPEAGSLASPATANRRPVQLTFSGAKDTDSGLKSVTLWVKKNASGTWARTALSTSAESGSFAFNDITGSDTYFFALQAEDNAGNVSTEPNGAGLAATVFESGLLAGSASSPAYVTNLPIVVSFSGVSTPAEGLRNVMLWYKHGANGPWTRSSFVSTGSSGTFAFTTIAGEGSYSFALQAESLTGDKTPEPSGAGDTTTVYDKTNPVAGTVSAPASTRTAPWNVSYSGASDSGSGLAGVALWVSKDGGVWSESGLRQSAGDGTFSFTPAEGSGSYAFAVVAVDKAGLTSAVPSGTGDPKTLYDATAPGLGTLTAPATASKKPIQIDFSGVSDAHSGLKAVSLWVRKGAGAWAQTALSSTAGSGSFRFEDMSENDTYHFALQAEDLAGNVTPAPEGDGATRTTYTRTLTAGQVSAPAYATKAPIAVSYTGAADSGGSVPKVSLWFKKGLAGTWTDSGLVSTAAEGSFAFDGVSGDDTYYFALQAEDEEGTRTAAPSANGNAGTVFDATLPNPGVATAAPVTKKLPLSIAYTGAVDAGSGLKQIILWIREGRTGTWQDTGLRSTTAPDGEFTVDSLSRDGRYAFYLQAEDKAGNKSPLPTEVAVTAP